MMPNPWTSGQLLLASLGYEALATTSGFAATLGRSTAASRDEA
jgi:hypothetical protein